MKKFKKILKKLRLRTLVSLGLIIIILPIIIFVMFRPQSTDASWYDEQYVYRKVLTIDADNISGSSNLVNFPVAVTFSSDANLSASAQADGDDIVFTDDKNNVLDFDIESYSSGSLAAWVEIPILSATTDTVIYMYYGNSAASSQENPTGIWGSSSYEAVYHFNNSLNDSSSNARNGTDNGTADTSSGKIGNGRDFENSESDYVDLGTWNITAGQAITLQGWVNMESFPASVDGRFISKGNGTGTSDHTWMVGYTDDNARARLTATSTSTYLDTLDNDYTSTATWYNFAFTYDGTNGRLYVNGVQTYFAGQTGDIAQNANSIFLGAQPTPASNNLDGILDEVRVLSTTRSADWLATEYTNQNNPSAFYSASAEQSRLAPPTVYWKFDEGADNTCSGGTNDACDSTSNGLDGAKTGASWQTSDMCISGSCLYFDGTDDYVVVSDNTQLDFSASDSFSVSLWYKNNNLGNLQYILSDHENVGADGGWRLRVNSDNTLHFGVTDDSTYPDDSISSNTGIDSNWHHIGLVVDRTNNRMYMYIDGVQQTDVEIGISATNLANDDDLRIGELFDGTNDMKGFIDELKIYRQARSASQMKADFINGSASGGSTSVLGASSQKFLSDGLVGYWKLDETATPSLDSSGNGRSGTWFGNTAGTGTSKFGKAADFDGTADYIAVADNDAFSLTTTNKLTVATWVNYDALTGTHEPVSKGLGSNFEWSIRTTSSGTVSARTFQSDGTDHLLCQSSSGAVTTGRWYHMAMVVDNTNTTLTLYINGTQACQDTSADGSYTNGTAQLQFGERDDSAFDVDGKVDEVRIYNRTLNSAEITALYNWAPPATLVWSLDENTGTTAYDRSGNALNGTLTNSPVWYPGRYGSGVSFTSSTSDNDHIVVSDNANLDFASTDSYTFSFFFKHATASSQEVILAKTNATAGYKVIMESDGDITCAIDDDTTWSPDASATSTAATYDDNNWHHVACVKEGASTLSLYIDGQFITSSSISGVSGTLENNQSMYVGIDGNGTGSDFTGLIDQVSIYRYARSRDQITEDLNAGHPVGGSPIGSQTIWWKFDEQTNTTAYDSVGNENGSISGASWLTKTSCKLNGCLSFDAANERVSIATASDADVDFNGTETFSGSAWVYVTTMPTSTGSDADAIIAKWDETSGQRAYRLYVENDDTDSTGNFEVQIYDDGTNNQAITATGQTDFVSTNTWYHVAFTFNGGTAGAAGDLKLYVNGNLVTQNTANASFSTLDDVTSDFTVGEYDATDAVAANTAFTGYIDEVKIYGSELTQSEILLDTNANSAINIASKYDEGSTTYGGPGGASPLGWWSMDDNTGGGGADIVDDVSGNNNHGDNHDMDDSNWGPGVYGSGLFFNGSNENVLINPATTFHNLGAVSVSAWIKPRSDGGSSIGRIISKGSWMISVSDSGTDSGDFTFYRTTSGTEVRAEAVPNSLTLNTWQHVMATWDGGLDASEDIKLYVNGQEVTYQTQQDGTGSVNDDSGNLLAFGSEPGGGFRYDGYMDEVKIWNYALTPAQAAYDYNRGRPIAHWKFDECQGSTVNSSSTVNTTGTITIGGSGDYTSVGSCSSGTSTESWNAGTNGKYNSALGLDGTNDYADMGDPASGLLDFGLTDSFTLSAWIYHDDAGASSERIIAKRIGGSSPLIGYYLVVTTNNQLQGTVDDGTNTISSTSSNNIVPTGAWTHVAYVVDRTNNLATIYANGTQMDQDSISGLGTLENTNTFRVGSASGSTTGAFDGKIDDVRVYNYALTTAQLKKLMNDDAAVRFGPNEGNP